MKSIEDIEKLSLDALMNIADDESVEVPCRTGLVCEAAAYAADAGSSGHDAGRSRLVWSLAGVAAAACIAVALVLHPAAPEDTFDDPYLAYAELERTLSLIADKMDRGVEIASSAEPLFDMTEDIMNKINSK